MEKYMVSKIFPIYKTARGYVVFVKRGKKSEFDFKVRYCLPGKNLITPKYIHFAVDLYAKLLANKQLTIDLIDHFIELISKIPPEKKFPPELLFFNSSISSKYVPLDIYGEYSAEFLLITLELFLRQKRQEYPNSTKSMKVLQSLRRQDDIYTMIQTSR
jgi:hypothetical protein